MSEVLAAPLAEKKPHTRWRHLLICSLALVVYWAIYDASIYSSTQGKEFFQRDYQVIPYEIDPNGPVPEDDLQDVQGLFVWPHCSGPCYVTARFESPNSTVDWGFVASYNTDNFRVLLNGKPIYQPGEFSDTPSFHGKRSWLVRLPHALLSHSQINTIDVQMVRYTDTPKINGAFLGPYAELEDALAPRFFLFYDLPKLNAIVALTIAALVILALPIAGNRAMLFSFALVVFSWALLALYRLWFTFPGDDELRAVYHFVIFNLVYAAFYVFFVYWSGVAHKRLAKVVVGLYVFSLLAYVVIGDRLTINEREALISDHFQLVVLALLSFSAVRHYFFAEEARLVESAAVFIAISSAALDTVAQVSGVFDFYSLNRTLPVFIVAVAASTFYSRVRLFETEQSKNAFLAQALAEARSELDRNYEREKRLERARVLSDERQRILQDMHDGVAGRLSALLQHQKSHPESDPSVTRELQQSLQDLVLIIDSLDEGLNEDLGSALGVLRSRLSPAIEDAGLQLDWRVQVPIDTSVSPERTLHIYRCLQEAIHNALRHGQARQLWVSAETHGARLFLQVRDDGVGIGTSSPGRGLTNLKRRAQALGADLSIDSSGSGTCLCLFLNIE